MPHSTQYPSIHVSNSTIFTTFFIKLCCQSSAATLVAILKNFISFGSKCGVNGGLRSFVGVRLMSSLIGHNSSIYPHFTVFTIQNYTKKD